MDPLVGVGIQLHCGQYLTLQRLEHERGFLSGCASVLGKALPLPTPALCYLKYDTEGRRKARERSEQIFTPTTSVVPKVVLFTLLASLLLLFIA